VSRPWLGVLLAALAPIASRAETILIEPGVSDGEDTAVYHFIPFLARGDYPSLYAFTIAEDNQAHDFRTFLHFDLPEELLGACVEQSDVYVYYGFDSSGFGTGENVPGTLTCEPVLAAWDEMTMTWNSQPAIGAPLDTVTDITAFGLLSCDITPLAQAWLDGEPNYGVALSSPTARAMGFYSSEAGSPVLQEQKPALAITIADDPQACPEPASAAAFATAAGALAVRRTRNRR
jgi:hypothetical protein